MSGSLPQPSAAFARAIAESSSDVPQPSPAFARNIASAGPQPGLIQRGLAGAARGAEALGAGAVAPFWGGAQFAGQAIKALTGYGGAADWANQYVRRVQGMESGSPVNALAGSVLSPFNLIAPEAVGGSRVLGGVLGGAGAAAAQPTAPDRAYWQNKIKQAAAGGLLGGGLGAASRVASRVAASPRAALAREGVRLSTPDVLLPERAAATTNRVLQITPGRFANAGQQRVALRDYQRVLYRWVLGPVGGSYGAEGPVGRDGLREVANAASAAYDRALGNRSVRLPTAGLLSPSWLAAGETVQAEGAVHALGLGREFTLLDRNAQEKVLSVLRQEVVHPLSVGQRGGVVLARDLKKSQSDLRDAAFRLMKSGDAHMQDAGRMLSEVASGFTDVIAGANPELATNLRAADDTWHRLALLQEAADRPAAKKGADEGVVSPRQMLDAMRSSDFSARHARWLGGSIPHQQMFETHRGVISEPTEENILGWEMGLGALGTAGLGFLGNASKGPAGVAAALAAARAPFGRAGSAAARALATSPAVARSLSRGAAPAGAAVGQETAQ